jgi:hypothetical protein
MAVGTFPAAGWFLVTPTDGRGNDETAAAM